MRCRAPIASTVDADGKAMSVTKPYGNPTQTALHWPNNVGEHVSGQLLRYFLLTSFPNLEGGNSSTCQQRGETAALWCQLTRARGEEGGQPQVPQGQVSCWPGHSLSRGQKNVNATQQGHRNRSIGAPPAVSMSGSRKTPPPCLEPPAPSRTFHGKRQHGADGRVPASEADALGSSLDSATNCTPTKADRSEGCV